MQSKLIIVLGLLYLLPLIGLAQNPQIIYVKKGADGLANGTSWTDAYPELQQAITAANGITGSKEIWVAQGEYKPTTSLDRTISFTVPAQTFLYGGFEGTESSKENRLWRKYRTVLSGDLGKQFDYSDNSFHVVYIGSFSEGLGIEGVFIKYGNPDGIGDHETGGGGLRVLNDATVTSAPLIRNVVFEENWGEIGAAIQISLLNTAATGPIIQNCEFNGNHVTQLGGAIFITGPVLESPNSTFINCSFTSNIADNAASVVANFGSSNFINCTFTYNNGSALYNIGRLTIRNSILWKNFAGTLQNPTYNDQIQNYGGAILEIQNSLVQGGYGDASSENIDQDPLFVREPSFIGVYPRTSIIPVSTTNPKYENQLEFTGDRQHGPWPYYVYNDHQYNKIYLPGWNLQILDYNNLVDNKPTSTIDYDFNFPRTARPERTIHNASNSIYIASSPGLFAINRATGQKTVYDLSVGAPGSPSETYANDVVIDNANNLLYTPVFEGAYGPFYGLLELNLTTQAKRWITTNSSPVSIQGGVDDVNDDTYWGGMRIFLDDQSNILYFSTGRGVWWWNRSTNATGLYSTTGGIPLQTGNPQLPSNKTTGFYMDNQDNKLYIGSHAGVFVWDKTNNTSRIYNKSNSKMIDEVINTIDKNEELHLIYVACEDGGLFIINTITGEEQLVTRDAGSNVYPQYMDPSSASAFYDEFDKKLYVSADHTTGGAYIMDYANLVPDYGDLRLQSGSPAIDRADQSFFPAGITTDLGGLNRFVDYATLFGQNSLDLGAFEREFIDSDAPPAPLADNMGINYVLTYTPQKEGVTDVSNVDSYGIASVNRTIQYFDGLGRGVQGISIQGSPTKKDVVTPVTYDAYGRQPLKYLPFTGGNNGAYQPDGVTNATNFYSAPDDPTITSDNRPYSETRFEASPLNRPDKDFGPGESWSDGQGGHNRFIQHQYLVNLHTTSRQSTDAGEAVIIWIVNNNEVQVATALGSYYASNELTIKATIDEQNHVVREYTNKQGQLILKRVQATENSSQTNFNNEDEWASTYYIYDDLDNLRFVLPPEAVRQYLKQQ